VITSLVVGCSSDSGETVTTEQEVKTAETTATPAAESTESAEESEASETEPLGNATNDVLSTGYADIQVISINRDNEKTTVVEIAIKNTTTEVLEVKPGCLFIENPEKAEGEKDFMWDIQTTQAPFLSEVRLAPGGMMVGEIGFKATPDQAEVLLINKNFDFFEKEERDRIVLAGEPSALAVTAEPDLSVFDTATQSAVGSVIAAIPDEEEITVTSWEIIEDSTKKPPMPGFCNIKVSYNFNNLKDAEMKGTDIKFAVLDKATGMLLQQGAFPLLDDELWIFEVEAKKNMDGFACYEVTKDGQYAVVINLPFKEDYTVVPLS
jgi:hypothetical protein